MHAFLIIGSDTDAIQKECVSRIDAWKISAWDTIRIAQDGTVGIEIIRDFERELALTPRNSPAKVGVLTDMDRLTPEAQNALLKTLEEPPPNTYIIGTTRNPEALLPTIGSRMSVVRLTDVSPVTDIAYRTLLQKLLSESPGKRLNMLDPYTATRDDAKNFITAMLAAGRDELLEHPSPKLAAFIRNLLTAQSQLAVNVNPKLVIDNAILHFV